MKKHKHLVIGMGEVGRPIYNILKDHYDVHAYDQSGMYFTQNNEFDVIHICFGHKENESEQFIQWVIGYQQKFLKRGGLTIIHATTAIGVTNQIPDAVHSPIRGMHYDMERSIRTFVKFFGGWRASEAAEYFRRIGIKVMLCERSDVTEAIKLFDTEYYRACVEFMQRVNKYCFINGLSFNEVYTLPNLTYNEGYVELGHSEFQRPILAPIKGGIGGHCLVPNSKLIELSEKYGKD